MGQAPLSDAECETVLAEFERGRQEGCDVQSVRAAVSRVGELLAPDVLASDPIDPRVRSAVESLRLESDENTSLADLAARAGVSESRFAHLFRRDVGLPMRQYRLALRIEEAFTQVSSGLSLTAAAHAAGFSDSAQFCRICRRMFGNAPSRFQDFETEAARRPPG
jgi:AraC-like DNA-binding protein